MDWLDLLAVQGTLESLLQHHSSKASILRCSAFFVVQLWHPYVTSGKTIALTLRTFVGKVVSLVFNMLSRLVIAFFQWWLNLNYNKEAVCLHSTFIKKNLIVLNKDSSLKIQNKNKWNKTSSLCLLSCPSWEPNEKLLIRRKIRN